MRILYFTYGGSIHDYRFLIKLAQEGYDCHYIYLSPNGRKYEVEGVKNYCLNYAYHEKDNFFYLMGKALPAYNQFKKLLRDIKPDILHTGWIPSVGLMAAISNYHPLLLMPWGSDVLIFPRRSRIHRKVVKYVIKHADMITCDAGEVKKKIIEIADYPEDKIITFPWGIDLRIFHPSKDDRLRTREELGWSDKKILIMTRTFIPVYGIEYFLRAIPKVMEEFPQIRVLIIGSGPLEGHFRRIVNELKIKDNVLFLGQIPNPELAKYLNAADIYVSSSLSDGTSLSLLEAMACALPVVVTDVPAILEWVQDGVNGLVVPRKNIKQLSEKISYLLQNGDLAYKMGKKNFEIAQERANWDKNFKKLEEIYTTLMRYNKRIEDF